MLRPPSYGIDIVDAATQTGSPPELPAGSFARPTTPTRVQRACEACEEEERRKVQRETAPGGCSAAEEAPPIVGETLSSAAGHPLDPPSLAFFGKGFGHDFSHVRVHTDSRAADSAKSIGALAYTLGANIVFGRGQYAPETHAGRRLIAHELSHVVQQSSGRAPVSSQALTVGPSDDPLEREAEAQADRVMSGERATVARPRAGSTDAHVQRAQQKRENGSLAAFAPWHAHKPIAEGQLLALTESTEQALLKRGTLLSIVAPANDYLKYHVKVMKSRTEEWGPSVIEGFVTAGWLEDTTSTESPEGAVVRSAGAKKAEPSNAGQATPAPAKAAPAKAQTAIAPGPARTNGLITGLLDENAKAKPKTLLAADSLVQIIGTDREGNFEPVLDAHTIRVEEPAKGSEAAKDDKGRVDRHKLTRVTLPAPVAPAPPAAPAPVAGPDIAGVASVIEESRGSATAEDIEAAFPTDMAGMLEVASHLSAEARSDLALQFDLSTRIGLAVKVVQLTLNDPGGSSSVESLDAIRNTAAADRVAIDAFIAAGANATSEALSTAIAVDAEAIASNPVGAFQARLASKVIKKLYENLALVDGLEAKYSKTGSDSPEWRHLREQVAPLVKQDLALVAELGKAKQARDTLRKEGTWVSQVSQGAHGEGSEGPEDKARNAMDLVDARFLIPENEVVYDGTVPTPSGNGGAGGAPNVPSSGGPDAARWAASLNRLNTRITMMEAAHKGFLAEYPIAGALEHGKDVPDLESNASNAEILAALRTGFFADFRANVKETIADIKSGDIDLHTLTLYIDETKQELGYDHNETANAAVDKWLADKAAEEETVQLVLTGVSIALTLAAFVVTGGTATFVVALLGAAAGMADAAYSFEKADDAEQLASAGEIGNEMVADRDAARFNYWMAVLGLALSALDLAQLKSAGKAALKGVKKGGSVADDVAQEGLEVGGKRGASGAAKTEVPASKAAAVKQELELEAKALAEIDSVEAGHKLWMDASGAIYRCSPTCTTLWLKYGDVLTDDANALIRRDLNDLEKRATLAAATGNKAEAKRIMIDASQLEARLKHAAAKKGVTKLPSPEALLEQKGFAHDIGVKHGRAHAQSSAGLKPGGFVNPFDHVGSHGQGFDDIMCTTDDLAKGNVFIVEYKGGAAKLADGQMELAWVLGNIRRLAIDGGESGKRWADTLMRAFRENRLKGVAFSTELDGAATKPTKKIGEWSYNP